MRVLGKYKNGNYMVTILEDGTKIRCTEENEFIPTFAENMDIKLCNRCDAGCPWCHEGSTPDGALGDIMNEEFINTLHPYQEVACLSGDTYVYNNNGAIQINELKIGDCIYDSDHILRKVISIRESNKKTYMLKGDRGIRIKCSEDHPFLSNGTLFNANQMVRKTIDRLKESESDSHEIHTIDLAKYIHKSNPKLPTSVGGRPLTDTSIRLVNNTSEIPRYINLNEQIMYLYGWFVAEGSSKGLTMNINEKNIAIQLGEIWRNTFCCNYRIYENKDTNSLSLELYSKTLVDAFFVEALKVGKGARNKTVGYLFSVNNKEMIRQALLGLFDGDGCYRKRKNKYNDYYMCSLKTTSRKLAYEVVFLLAKHFGIYSSVYHGNSPERKIEDRILNESDYYSVEIYGAENLLRLFPERFTEIVIKSKQKLRTDKINSIEKITDEPLYDITLDSGSHVFPVNGYVLTHNCGGGNVLEHPDLIPFLIKLREKNVIPNITINQIHFEREFEFIYNLSRSGLVFGIGISLMNATVEFIEKVKMIPNAVIHVINGVFTEKQHEILKDEGLKVLILGYKHLRRGFDYYDYNETSVIENQTWLMNELKNMMEHYEVLSFDNLAIEQLNVKGLLTEEEWESFYMGDDGTSTYYIDMVERKFARSSTAPIDQRFDLLNNVDEMFKIITEEMA